MQWQPNNNQFSSVFIPIVFLFESFDIAKHVFCECCSISDTKMNQNDNTSKTTAHGQRYSIGVKWKEKPKIESVSMENSLPFTASHSTLCDFRFSVRLVRFVSFEFVLCCLESCFSPFMNFLAKCFECGVGGGNAALRKTTPHRRLAFIFPPAMRCWAVSAQCRMEYEKQTECVWINSS